MEDEKGNVVAEDEKVARETTTDLFETMVLVKRKERQTSRGAISVNFVEQIVTEFNTLATKKREQNKKKREQRHRFRSTYKS